MDKEIGFSKLSVQIIRYWTGGVFLDLIIFMGMILIIKFMSLRWIWRNKQKQVYRLTLSLENFMLLIITYVTLFIGFGAIYAILQINGFPVLVEGEQLVEGAFLQLVNSSMYFSAVTILSVGYGDLTPIGIGRWISIIEALLGFLLPAAFVVRTVIDIDR